MSSHFLLAALFLEPLQSNAVLIENEPSSIANRETVPLHSWFLSHSSSFQSRCSNGLFSGMSLWGHVTIGNQRNGHWVGFRNISHDFLHYRHPFLPNAWISDFSCLFVRNIPWSADGFPVPLPSLHSSALHLWYPGLLGILIEGMSSLTLCGHL